MLIRLPQAQFSQRGWTTILAKPIEPACFCRQGAFGGDRLGIEPHSCIPYRLLQQTLQQQGSRAAVKYDLGAWLSKNAI